MVRWCAWGSWGGGGYRRVQEVHGRGGCGWLEEAGPEDGGAGSEGLVEAWANK